MLRDHFKLAVAIGFLVAATVQVRADAIMRSKSTAYPARVLRHTVTEISVDIHGFVAETRAYAEFKNDWDQTTDAVYSFPLPVNAHATQLLYTTGGAVAEATLKEIPQSNVPGTGDGGFAAELGEYLGKNKVTLEVRGIPARGIAKIEIRYVQKLDFENGRIGYFFPLATQPFAVDPLDHAGIIVKVWKPWPVKDWASESHAQGWTVLQNDASALCVRKEESKSLLDRDFEWSYAPTLSEFSMAAVSAKLPDSAGYVLASLLPPLPAAAPATPRSVLFLIDRSRSMTGFKLEQSTQAVKACLAFLKPEDTFAIGTFDYNQSMLVPFQSPTADAILRASAELDTLAKAVGMSASNLSNGINGGLQSFPDGAPGPLVFLFSDGLSDFRPSLVANPAATPVFALGMGREVNRARLDAVAGIGNGLAIYFREDEAIQDKASALFKSVSQPAMTASALTGPSGRLLDPMASPASKSLWNWGGEVLVARYSAAGPADITLNGNSGNSRFAKTFPQNLAADTAEAGSTIAIRYWAAEKIRALEDRIDLNGMDQTARQDAVRLSLLYKVKSRYTSYQSETLPAGPDDHPITSSLSNRRASSDLSMKVERSRGAREVAIRINMPATIADMKSSLKVFDLRGHLIRILEPRLGSDGSLRFTWDGLDRQGSAVNGPVMLVFRVGDRTLSRCLAPA